ncbi:kazal-type serine protease inhibitor domain-containing protein 1-like [Hydractinia symbiolongicarpus]|uniref:kazal-type serine protease inhibitor domain-containing protein 1-like n=1 Tax=Hydractinia symbiolongicarpus TaxID=13093 RepID=UPI00254ACAA6|nr:kazal-type serine protease inhibitor domain-containing protein 1-like [Hydractinia symbiolongicarpus]
MKIPCSCVISSSHAILDVRLEMMPNIHTKCFLLFCLVIFVEVRVATTVACKRCKWWKCPKISSLSCPAGHVKDTCLCCYECGLMEGQTCGIDTPSCGTNLFCRRDKPTDKNGICRSKYDITSSLGLPPCYSHAGYNVKVDYHCRYVTTTFCSMDCKSCCSHRTTCNPDPSIYKDADLCKKEQKSIPGLPRKIKL